MVEHKWTFAFLWTLGNGIGWFLFVILYMTAGIYEQTGADGAIFLQIVVGFILFSFLQWLPIRQLHPKYLVWVGLMFLAWVSALLAIAIVIDIFGNLSLPEPLSAIGIGAVIGTVIGYVQTVKWRGRRERKIWIAAYTCGFVAAAVIDTFYPLVLPFDGVIFGVVSSGVLIYLPKLLRSNTADLENLMMRDDSEETIDV